MGKHACIAIIGGGPAGLTAAIVAARAGGRVTVFDAADRVGKTILATGAGRCNIANVGTSAALYNDAAFVGAAFEALTPERALGFLHELGLVLREEERGRLYPCTGKATSVVDVLRAVAAESGVREVCHRRVLSIRRADEEDLSVDPDRETCARLSGGGNDDGIWALGFADGSHERFDAVICAVGHGLRDGLIPATVPVTAMQPLLCPLETDTDPIKGLDKIRVRCTVALGDAAPQSGEVTFRRYGASGIIAFDLSRFAHPGDTLHFDFLPEGVDTAARLASMGAPTWKRFCDGMLLPRLTLCVLAAAGLDPDARADEAGLAAFDASVHDFRLTVKGTAEPDLAQIHRGGIATSSVDPTTMQLNGCAGLFACGEALDVDGPCGGYNLHWVWVSGLIAGAAAAGNGRP